MVQKLVQVLDGISVKNAPNISAKYLQDQIYRIKRIKNKSAKNFSEKLKNKEDSSKPTIPKVLSEIPSRKKISKQQ